MGNAFRGNSGGGARLEELYALLAFLNVLQFRREGVDSEELRRRIDDRSKEAWVPLDDARQRLAD